MKKFIIWVVVILIVVFGFYLLFKRAPTENYYPANGNTTTTTQTASSSQPVAQEDKTKTVIGQSAENRDIVAYHFGSGDKELLFVGGIHGGYEWNTVLLAYQLMDYLKKYPNAIPAGVKVTVIPVLNPDGLNKVVGTTTGNFSKADVSNSQSTVIAGRFNANNVDLSRNFDCDWQASGTWQSRTVSGGDAAFSEPESLAFKNYVDANSPSAVVFWYSSAGGVYSSSCDAAVSSETKSLTTAYASASGYTAYSKFNAYPVTGDVVDWLAKENIPAVSVLLATHDSSEWAKNWAGIQAVLKSYAQ